MNGYMGKMLWVDLSNKKITEEILDEKLCHTYIGGYGLGARILFERMKPGIDPLSPQNILGFLTGPFTGTPALGGARYVVVGKSPLTGTWGDANSGGNFGPYLRFSGYDAVFFTGTSPKPVYLVINNGVAEIKDAASLWGKDTYDTEDMLRSELGQDTEVACIGPAGEKLSLIAAIINNKGRAAARSGLAAVMGSKKLKAIAVKGKIPVPLFDAAKVNEIRKNIMTKLAGPSGLFKQTGTSGITVFLAKAGDTPVKNWGGAQVTDFPQIDKLDAKSFLDLQQKRYGCYRCVIACGGHMKEGTGEYQYQKSHRPEYETIGMFGPNCLNDNVESIMKVNDLCNSYGVDTISAGSTIAFAIECYENGLITKEDTDGIEMTWGNHKSIVAMTEKLVKREGFGAILADGSKKAAERIGNGTETYAMQMQGQDYGAHDPRWAYPAAMGYRMDPTPGRHTRAVGGSPPGLIKEKYDATAFSGRGEVQKTAICFQHVAECVGCCMFVSDSYPEANVLVEFLNAITGWNLTMDDVLKAGERILDMRQSFNIREGINPLEFKVQGRMVGKPPLQAGPNAGRTLDEATIDRELCEAMKWDVKTTKPSEQRLIELGMGDIARELKSVR
jgi:aldehyde:ferredoxin oxidoreductase